MAECIDELMTMRRLRLDQTEARSLILCVRMDSYQWK